MRDSPTRQEHAHAVSRLDKDIILCLKAWWIQYFVEYNNFRRALKALQHLLFLTCVLAAVMADAVLAVPSGALALNQAAAGGIWSSLC